MDDLARIQLARTGVAATIEAVYSSIALRHADSPLSFGDWGRRLRPRLGTAVAPLFDLVRTPADVPYFLIKRTDDPDELAEHLISLPAGRIHAELTARRGRDSAFARRLAGGDRAARTELATAIGSYHRAFADSLPAMHALIQADLVHRSTQLATGGLGVLLDSLHPAVRWRSPVLELDVGDDREMDLGGRILQLTPSVFMHQGIGVLIEPSTVFVTYPARGTLALSAPGGDPLVDLLGRTRAAALRALRIAHTTSELAATLGISLASASEHAAILRRASLIDTHREGRAVRHRLTRLGLLTLAAEAP